MVDVMGPSKEGAVDWIRWFDEVGIDDVGIVGGKNASLGEMYQELSASGVRVPYGFAVTADAYRAFIDENGLEPLIRSILAGWNRDDVGELAHRSREIRRLIRAGEYPHDLAIAIDRSYHELSESIGVDGAYVAVRSSATAEDLPTASFAGQQETYLMVHGDREVREAVRNAFASLFTARAINYREDMGFDHMSVALSVGVQQMVRADSSASGVAFTLDTETGFRDVVVIDSIWGLGENIVQGKSTPDEYVVHVPTLRQGFHPIIRTRMGAKELLMSYDEHAHEITNRPTPARLRNEWSLDRLDVLALARWAVQIEDHYSTKRGVETPMDIEWAKDGVTGNLYIVQARPETVHSQAKTATLRTCRLLEEGEVLTSGIAVGNDVATGTLRLITKPSQMDALEDGDILVTSTTDPDWEPVMKRSAAIVTERGGRTSHAAIVARELGIPAVVGAGDALRVLTDGEPATVSCTGDDGLVYRGELAYEVEEIDAATLPATETKIMLNMGDPSLAFGLASLPVDGVGLARMEFILASHVGVHPLALLHRDQLELEVRREVDAATAGYEVPSRYFVDRLAEGIATIAAAMYPRPVILRFSDFKSNEYRSLIGGEVFEPIEENPMIGWRGASRYYDPDFVDAFLLEVEAIRRVRDEFGLTNLHVMIPFCRTVREGEQVLEILAKNGLERGQDGLRVYVMAEIPANILLADQFAELFDGFSIGSNDLTQLTLGVDRDSDRVAPLLDERNDAVKLACKMLIEAVAGTDTTVGICGQAPSDYPDFAAFLVETGIDSISVVPDALVATRMSVADIEAKLR